MAKEDIAPYQRNLALKQEFKFLRLDLAEVMEFSPFDLDLENRRFKPRLVFPAASLSFDPTQVNAGRQ